MFEISWINTKKKTRTVLSIGHGLPGRGQLCKISLFRECLTPRGNEVDYATMLWKLK